MRWTFALSLAVLLLALPAQSALSSDSRTQTIRLVSITTSVSVVRDGAPKGEPNKGDVIRARSTLRNERAQFGKPKGAVVGSDVGTYTLLSATLGDVKVTVKLPGGTLRAAGRIRDGVPNQTIRVTGGTGTFAGARGTLATSPLNASGNRALNVYRLQLP